MESTRMVDTKQKQLLLSTDLTLCCRRKSLRVYKEPRHVIRFKAVCVTILTDVVWILGGLGHGSSASHDPWDLECQPRHSCPLYVQVSCVR